VADKLSATNPATISATNIDVSRCPVFRDKALAGNSLQIRQTMSAEFIKYHPNRHSGPGPES